MSEMKFQIILIALFFLWFSTSCGQSKPSPIQSDAGPGVHWQHANFEEALKLAAKEKKPLLVEFFSPDCSHCEEMNQFMSTKPAGDFINPKLVPLKISLTSDEGLEFLKKYRIKDYPKFYLFSPDGELQDIFSAGHDTTSFKYYVDRYKNNGRTYKKLNDLLAKGETLDTTTLKDMIKNLWTTKNPLASKAIDAYISTKTPDQILSQSVWDITRRNADGIDHQLAKFLQQNRQKYYDKYGEKDVKSLLQYFASSEVTNGLSRGIDRKEAALQYLRDAALTEEEISSSMSWAMVIYYEETNNAEKLAESYNEYFKYKKPLPGMYSFAILKLAKLNPPANMIPIMTDWLDKSEVGYGAEAQSNSTYLYTKAYVLFFQKKYKEAANIIANVIERNRSESRKTGEQIELQKKINEAINGDK